MARLEVFLVERSSSLNHRGNARPRSHIEAWIIGQVMPRVFATGSLLPSIPVSCSTPWRLTIIVPLPMYCMCAALQFAKKKCEEIASSVMIVTHTSKRYVPASLLNARLLQSRLCSVFVNVSLRLTIVVWMLANLLSLISWADEVAYPQLETSRTCTVVLQLIQHPIRLVAFRQSYGDEIHQAGPLNWVFRILHTVDVVRSSHACHMFRDYEK